MRSLVGLIAIGIAALSVPAGAQDSAAHSLDVDEAYRHCIDNTHSTPEVRACGDALLVRLDARLNERWQRLIDGYLGDGPRRRLVEEQRAWIRYRDSACRFYLSDAFGSQGASGDFPLCLARLIQHRIDELEVIQRNLDESNAS